MIIETLHLFRPLHHKLMEVLRSLDQADWEKKTLAREWNVKDVTAHLLDVTLRTISVERDHHQVSPPAINQYSDLVAYLNRLNADWVLAMQRVSPTLLIKWLDAIHPSYIGCLEQLDLRAPARYGVAWAGESESLNWFHIAREYTEHWHHQQQIRFATGRPELVEREFYHPVLQTFLLALPFNYRNTDAPAGTQVEITVEGEAGGTWVLERSAKAWKFTSNNRGPKARVTMKELIAWKLFTKGVRAEDVRDQVSWEGQDELVAPALRMIAVIA